MDCDSPIKHNACLTCKLRCGISSSRVISAFDKCKAVPLKVINDPYQGKTYKHHLCREVRRNETYCMYYKPTMWERVKIFFRGFN